MSDTAKRIGPLLLAGGPATIYTAPLPLDLRNLNIANTSGSAATATVSIGPDAAGTRLIAGVSIPANSVYTWSGFVPLEVGDTLQAYSGTPSVLTLTGGGSVGVD